MSEKKKDDSPWWEAWESWMAPEALNDKKDVAEVENSWYDAWGTWMAPESLNNTKKEEGE